jgi:hypothetical protein
MKNTFLILILLLLISNDSSGQKKFTVKDGSKTYWAIVSVDNFVNNDCSGAGSVSLFDKAADTLFQTVNSDNLCFYINGDANPTEDFTELTGEQSPLIFDDFNFDGYEDVAISNGNNGSYGMPSYDVYLYNKEVKQFTKDIKLTEIASTNLGMFRTEKSKKRLITYNKSGCCWHITTEYEILNNELVKVYELEEDATDGSIYVTVTERKLVNRVWYLSVKKLKIEDYYKNN